jgi:hypothetical protein
VCASERFSFLFFSFFVCPPPTVATLLLPIFCCLLTTKEEVKERFPDFNPNLIKVQNRNLILSTPVWPEGILLVLLLLQQA